MLSFFRNKLTLLGQAWATTAPSTASSAMMQAIRHTSSSQPSEYITTNLENGVGRYVCQLQRITFRFCKESPGSQGMRSVWLFFVCKILFLIECLIEFYCMFVVNSLRMIWSILQEKIRAWLFTWSRSDTECLKWMQNTVRKNIILLKIVDSLNRCF